MASWSAGIFDANSIGIWAFHCHLIYHLVTGMFTVLKYDDADIEFWQPEKQASELQHLAPFEITSES